MAEQIIVKFRATGDKKLIKSMYALAHAQALLEKKAKKAAVAQGFLGTAFKRNAANASKMGLAMSTLRSKLLLATFAFGGIISAAFKFAQAAAKVEDMKRAFQNLAGVTENATIALSRLRRATDGTVSDFDLLKQANNAMILGVTTNSKEMAKMFDMAQRLGKALGVDTKSSIESLITGIGRQSKLMLDNIGIVVKSEDAYKDYAKILGISKDKLTDAQKKQAFMTATMDAAEKKVGKLGSEIFSTTDSFSQLSTELENSQVLIGEIFGEVFATSLAGDLNTLTTAFRNLFSSLDLIDTETEKALSPILEEQIKVKTLVKILQDANVESKLYKDTKEDLFNMYPSLLSHLDSEESSLKDIKIATDEYSDALDTLMEKKIKEIAIDALEEDIGKITKGFAQLAGAAIDSGTTVEEAGQSLFGRLHEKSRGWFGVWGSIAEAINLMTDADTQLDAMSKGADITTLFGTLGGEDFLELLSDETQQVQEAMKLLMEWIGNIEVSDDLELVEKNFGGAADKIKEVVKTSEELAEAEKNINSLTQATTSFWLSSQKGARTWRTFGDVMVQQMERIISTFIAQWAAWKFMSEVFSGFTGVQPSLFGWTPTTEAPAPTEAGGFHNGGIIPSYHQGGDVPIMAQEGEFVMRRSAVESIGLENLARMNRTGQSGGVNINFSGNVLSSDFIENEAIPKIKDAVRRGADIGIS